MQLNKGTAVYPTHPWYHSWTVILSDQEIINFESLLLVLVFLLLDQLLFLISQSSQNSLEGQIPFV